MIYINVSVDQAFLKSAGNLVNSGKLLDSGIKCDTFETESTKEGNVLFSSFTKVLNTLCQPLIILLANSSAAFCSFFLLMWSHIFNLAYLALVLGVFDFHK